MSQFSLCRNTVCAVGLVLLFSAVALGQEALPQTAGAPDDWTHHRLIFSDPGTPGEAARKGNYGEWLKTVHDARFLLQRRKRIDASRRYFRLDGIFEHRPGDSRDGNREPNGVSPISLDALPRGLVQTDAAWHGRAGLEGHPHRSKAEQGPNSLQKDWSEDMGAGAKAGLGMYPAKYSFLGTSANCSTASQPDYVVYNTSLTGLTGQASILAYDNLYSGCSGSVPSTYWAYNTGGTIVTSVALSLDGTQVAFAQTSSGGSASLVLLKWKSSNTETASSPGTPTSVTAANYRACAAPCMVALTFSGAANDSGSSVFSDYDSDAIYVGDDGGQLHKFTGVFHGTPAEALGGWPVSVSSSALSSPVADTSAGRVFVGSYLLNSTSTCGPSGDPCGFLYAVDSATGSVSGTSNRLDYNFGIVDAPLVDTSAGRVYVFAGDDGGTACAGSSPCSGVFQFAADFTSGSGTEATLGPGYEFLLDGAFDNAYFTSDATSPTGHLYAVGSTGAANNTLYRVSINSNVMSATATAGPEVSANFTNGLFSAGLSTTEILNTTSDYIFLSVLSYGAPAACSASLSNGCVMGFDVTSGSIDAATTPTGATPEAGGTSGIIVDNSSAFSGASNIYYTPLADQVCATSGGTGGCAIQISQAAP